MHFDSHRGLSQSEENKFMWTQCKYGAMWQELTNQRILRYPTY